MVAETFHRGTADENVGEKYMKPVSILLFFVFLVVIISQWSVSMAPPVSDQPNDEFRSASGLTSLWELWLLPEGKWVFTPMVRVRIAIGLLIGSCACSAVRPLYAAEVAWTMVVVPDTQNYRSDNGQLPKLYDMMQWIVDNKDTRNIELVGSQGDFTGNGIVNWTNQADAWATLNGEVPYIVVTGNHDYDPFGSLIGTDHDATLVNDFFALSDNPLNSITTERIPGRIENSYSTFEAPDGRNMLVFGLEWLPRTEVLDWANTIAGQAQFADHTTVLLTHAYLREWNVAPDGSDQALLTPEGQPIWDSLASQHENFELVMNGHYLDWNDTNPYGPLTTARQSSIGVEGNTVHEIVFNAQESANGGNGYMRLMEFMDDGTTVQVRTYSPTLDVWMTNDRNEFQIQLTPLFSGDFDEDQDVDGADFLAWQRGFGISENATLAQGDANSDGAVDGEDLIVWQQQAATVALSALTEVVPEPNRAALLILAFLLLNLPRMRMS